MNVNETHEKIIGFLDKKGPSLPINVAKELSTSSLFISAFLSELYNEKRIRMSHLKVGGSPLYFLDGQEEQLESYYKFMHPREAEVFLLLKNNKVLRDVDQEPAVRVALRSIRDFAVGFKIGEQIYWRYILISEGEANDIVSGKEVKREKEVEEKEEKVEKKEIKKEVKQEVKQEVKEIVDKKKKQKSKSEFVLRVVDFINRNGLKIVEEKEYKVKEYNCIVQIRSELGVLDFLTQAKDKKIISEVDLMKLLSNSQSVSLPAFMLYTGELGKKAKDYLQKYKSILKVKKVG